MGRDIDAAAENSRLFSRASGTLFPVELDDMELAQLSDRPAVAVSAESFSDTSAVPDREVGSTLLVSAGVARTVSSRFFEAGAVDSTFTAAGVPIVLVTVVPDTATGLLGVVGWLVVFVEPSLREPANHLLICGVKNAAIPLQTRNIASIKAARVFRLEVIRVTKTDAGWNSGTTSRGGSLISGRVLKARRGSFITGCS
jgi:hypothetical protein